MIFNMYYCCNLLSRPHTNAFAAVEEKKEGTKNEELQNHLILPLLSLCFDYYSLNSRAFLPLAPTISLENGPKMSHFPTLRAKLVA